MQTHWPLVLASGSPRRSELLDQIGLVHSVHPVDIDESAKTGESGVQYTSRLACEKARACAEQVATGSIILAADTAVCVDDSIIGKPQDKADAQRTLLRLSARSHEVITAFALLHHGKLKHAHTQTRVNMGPITRAQIDDYWASGEPCDKAGSYAIQGLGAQFVRSIEGSYSNVVGLPLFELCEMLKSREMIK
ncbi:MAG: Maf family protein [Pseudomonadota bacterium]